jgi:hypothetical protein
MDSKSVEDELFDLLNSPDPVSSSILAKSNLESAPSINLDDSNDFLSWLDDSPGKKANDSEVKSASAPSASSVDDFFNEVEQPIIAITKPHLEEEPLQPESNKVLESIYQEMFEAEVPIQKTNEANHLAYEKELANLIDAAFPDTGRIRELIDTQGYLPDTLRVQALLVLLNGSCHLDDEAEEFKVSETEREFYRDILNDCQSLLDLTTSNSIKSLLLNEILDIVVLFSQRRSVDYKNIYGRILISIYGGENVVKKPLASSYFYALTSQFLPFVNLQVRIYYYYFI